MTKQEKDFIDNADYETLLGKWRFANIGNPLFQGETGDYYKKVMLEKKADLKDSGVQASKNIGW